jgi:FSR family fosmidomycin resistance protein-like MFS transporter
VVAAAATFALLPTLRSRRPQSARDKVRATLFEAARQTLRQMRSPQVLRRLGALEASDLVLDVLTAFVAVYLVDAARASPAIAAMAVAVRAGAMLAGDALAVPLLDRLPGHRLLRITAPAVMVTLAGMLLIPSLPAKVALLGLSGLLTAGWYAVLKADVYDVLPGRGGTVLVASNVGGLVGAALPGLLGLAAQQLGIGSALWFLLAGPITVMVLLPRRPSVVRGPG